MRLSDDDLVPRRWYRDPSACLGACSCLKTSDDVLSCGVGVRSWSSSGAWTRTWALDPSPAKAHAVMRARWRA